MVEWIGSGGGAAMGLDGSRMALAGDSAGGGLAAAVTLYFKENLPTLLPSIKGLVRCVTLLLATVPICTAP